MRIIWYKDSPAASAVSIIGSVCLILALVFGGAEQSRPISAVMLILGAVLMIAGRIMAGSKNSAASKAEKKRKTAVAELLSKAEEARKANNPAGEIAALQPLATSSGAPAEILALLGGAYTRAGEYDKAIQLYKNAIQKDKACASAYAGAANTYIVMEKYTEALYYANKSAALTSPESADYPAVLANCAIALGKGGEKQSAEEMLKKAEAAGYQDGDKIRAMIYA